MGKIPYHKIIALGFTEEVCHDSVYFNEFGFDYAIISFNLTKKIQILWAKETQFCKMQRYDKKENVLATLEIENLTTLENLINFYTAKL